MINWAQKPSRLFLDIHCRSDLAITYLILSKSDNHAGTTVRFFCDKTRVFPGALIELRCDNINL